MDITSMTIEHFKGFHRSQRIDFNTPDDDTKDSGLNIFVGKNNSAKSTIFDAFDCIKASTRKDAASLVNKSDPAVACNHFSAEITYKGNISATVDAHAQANKVRSFTKILDLF